MHSSEDCSYRENHHSNLGVEKNLEIEHLRLSCFTHKLMDATNRWNGNFDLLSEDEIGQLEGEKLMETKVKEGATHTFVHLPSRNPTMFSWRGSKKTLHIS